MTEHLSDQSPDYLEGRLSPEEKERFLDFCEKTESVPICLSDFEQFEEFPVYVYHIEEHG